MPRLTAPVRKLHVTPSVYFVQSSKNLIDTLFLPGGTASGTFKQRKRGVLFHKPDGEPFAYLAAHESTPFFVTCSRQEDGRIRYMFGLADCDALRLGILGMRFSLQRETAREVWENANSSNPIPA